MIKYSINDTLINKSTGASFTYDSNVNAWVSKSSSSHDGFKHSSYFEYSVDAMSELVNAGHYTVAGATPTADDIVDDDKVLKALGEAYYRYSDKLDLYTEYRNNKDVRFEYDVYIRLREGYELLKSIILAGTK